MNGCCCCCYVVVFFLYSWLIWNFDVRYDGDWLVYGCVGGNFWIGVVIGYVFCGIKFGKCECFEFCEIFGG